MKQNKGFYDWFGLKGSKITDSDFSKTINKFCSSEASFCSPLLRQVITDQELDIAA